MIARILVVDDEVKMGVLLASTLEDEGYEVTRTERGDHAVSLLRKSQFDLVITDLKMSPVGGLSVLQEARRANPECVVLLMTAHDSVETAVSAMKAGAADYLAKPFSLDEMVMLVRRQLEARRLADQVQVLKTDLARFVATDIVGKSGSFQEVLDNVSRAAQTDASVLITGESGTGKELVARAIHAASPRRDGPFVAIDCAALPETLLELELFGHEKGAVAGAEEPRRGRLELAHGGTIFLDEVGEIAQSLQAKLLRVLEEQAFTRVGGTLVHFVDVREVAATKRDLIARVHERTFRKDLFSHLNTFPIHVPPLRERGDDCIELAEHFLRGLGSNASLSPDARRALQSYDWPGNVRELRNVLECVVMRGTGDAITAADLNLPPRGQTPKPALQVSDGMVGVEKHLIVTALDQAGGNKTEAARILKISRRMLYSRMKKHGLPV